MRNRPIIFIALFLLVGCGLVASCSAGLVSLPAFGEIEGTPQRSQPAEVMALATASATMEPTVTPLPTFDAAIYVTQTQLAVLDSEAKSLNEKAEANRKMIENERLAGEVRRYNQDTALTPTALAMTGTAAAATAENNRVQYGVMVLTPNAAEIKEKELELVKATNAENLSNTMKQAAIFVISAGVLLVIIILFRKFWVSMDNAEAPDDEGEPAPQPEQTIKLPQFVGGVSVKVFTDSHITPAQLYALAKGWIDDNIEPTHDNWTPAENGFSEGTFQKLQYLLVKYGCAQWKTIDRHEDGIEITHDGAKFFSDILAGSPPPSQDVSKPPSTATKQSIDDGFTPLPVGE